MCDETIHATQQLLMELDIESVARELKHRHGMDPSQIAWVLSDSIVDTDLTHDDIAHAMLSQEGLNLSVCGTICALHKGMGMSGREIAKTLHMMDVQAQDILSGLRSQDHTCQYAGHHQELNRNRHR